MTQTINGCPVCASTNGNSEVIGGRWRWVCYECGAVSRNSAQIPVPSSISQHTEAAESAERKRGEEK